MFDHPYLAYAVTEHDQQQVQRDAERRRFLKENADRIVPRPAGHLRRIAARMRRALRVAGAADRMPAARRSSTTCEPAR